MDAYYYAAGEKVELTPSNEYVAIKQDVAQQLGIDLQLGEDAGVIVRAGAGLLVVQCTALPPHVLERLQQAKAVHPVFHRGSTVVVALPEVRVEFDGSRQRKLVMNALPKAPKHTIVEDTADRLVVAPASGNAEDALDLANRIHEQVKSASAAPRFVQFVPKPQPTKR